MSILSHLRGSSVASDPTPSPDARRAFFRRMGGLSIGALGVGLLTADDAWAAVEERAGRFGIVPGSLVDAQGKPVDNAPTMLEPMIGQINMFGFNFAPRSWALCDGQLLPISSNTALFSLLGTIYGGDGRTTFGLPDLRGRTAIHAGSGPGLTPRTLGQRSGAEQVTLEESQIPSHAHAAPFSDGPGGIGGAYERLTPAGGATDQQVLTGATGGGQAHDNMPPFLAVNHCIALQGLFPSRN